MNRNQFLTLRAMRRNGVGRIVTVLVAVAGALACASVRGPYIPVEDYPSVAPETEYHIAPGDLLAVRVWNQDSMSNPHARVRDDGKISLPFLQDVDVAGTTPTELSQRLQTKLKAFVVNPVVTVTVEEFRPLHVEVLGEVVHPGQFELDRGAGVLAALAVAGGLTDYAHRDSIFVLRSTGTSTGPTRIRFRYASLIAGERPAASFRLHAGDVVVVE